MVTFCTLLFGIDLGAPSPQRGKYWVSYSDNGIRETRMVFRVPRTFKSPHRFVYLRVIREGAVGRPLNLRRSGLPAGGQCNPWSALNIRAIQGFST